MSDKEKKKVRVAFESLHAIADREKFPDVFDDLMPMFLSIYGKDLKSMSNREIDKIVKELYAVYAASMEVLESWRKLEGDFKKLKSGEDTLEEILSRIRRVKFEMKGESNMTEE